MSETPSIPPPSANEQAFVRRAKVRLFNRWLMSKLYPGVTQLRIVGATFDVATEEVILVVEGTALPECEYIRIRNEESVRSIISPDRYNKG